MRYFVSASKDATIYETLPNTNTGCDEILEIGKYWDSVTEKNGAARSLLYFDFTGLASIVTGSSVINLNLVVANAEKLRQTDYIYVYAASRSWDEGSGYLLQDQYVSSDGATWRSYASGSYWAASGSDYRTNVVSSASVADIGDILRINVHRVVNPIVIGTATNHGLALMFSGSSENDSSNYGNVKVFSRNTHTIHEPFIEFLYSNETFTTGSLVALSNFDVEIVPKNLKTDYMKGEITKLCIVVRDKYPQRTYSKANIFAGKYYLPATTQYSITDVGSGRTIIPFDSYSLIQCDATNGNYVLLDTTPLFKGRFYEIQLKVILGSEIYYTKKFGFEVL